ncbi:hypothetical protein [Burkholderia sp. D-99]|uniref:hypothetical protein n=1 Tax=Burkholderia sp. D-99 TaxID=2717316 RepID=UPI00141E2CF0|nr:hypothetical protein [Burkholderia sp. D-99]NHV28592.1 hypothetical protein [Burkholderia sp. D-99]
MNLERDIAAPILSSKPIDSSGRKMSTTMVQKNFRLPYDLAQKLKLYAVQQSVLQGSRVTETDVIEALLRGYLSDGMSSV